MFLTFITSSSLFSRFDRELLLPFTAAPLGFVFAFAGIAARAANAMAKTGPKWWWMWIFGKSKRG
jgi:hypothetical protein